MKNHKLNTRDIKNFAQKYHRNLHMLTCYDFQTAQLLNETSVDLILVGDSLNNVILGEEHTISAELSTMELFSKAVKKGAPDKFVIADMPFGTYAILDQAVLNAIQLFKSSGVEALKVEGAAEHILTFIKRAVEVGIPIMGHIGLTPQSVHELGGYFTHGKDDAGQMKCIEQALALEASGVFAIVLECVDEKTSKIITEKLKIPTIGIGSGKHTTGQVLVINDLLKMGKNKVPSFCQPIANLYEMKLELINQYLKK